MTVLIIIVEYKPSNNPNITRWSSIAEEWLNMGHEVHVLTSRNNLLTHREHINGVTVHRVGYATLFDFAKGIVNKNLSRDKSLKAKSNMSSFVTSLVQRIIDLTWRKIYWPDGSMIWYGSAKRKLKGLMMQHQFDLIVSVCLPFTCTKLALTLKQKYPQTFWIHDIQDPFAITNDVPQNNIFLYGNRNRIQEKKALLNADKIVVTNHRIRQMYHEWASIDQIEVIPPLWLPSTHSKASLTIAPKKGLLHFGYFGSFYSHVREPDLFIELMTALIDEGSFSLNDIQIHLFGQMEEFFRTKFDCASFSRVLVYHGLVDQNDVSVWMSHMNFLLSQGNTTDYHLPSKVVDYYASKKPIIHFSCTDHDPVVNYFSNYPLFSVITKGHSLKADLESAVDFITYHHQPNETPEFDTSTKLTEHLPKKIAELYISDVG